MGTESRMRKRLPQALVCVECGLVFGSILEPSKLFPEGPTNVDAICASCVTRLSEERGVSPDSAENWSHLLRDSRARA